MALQFPKDGFDRLFAAPPGTSQLRLQTAACLYLASLNPPWADPNRCVDLAYRTELANILSRNKQLLENTKSYVSVNVVGDSMLAWVIDDTRQQEWVAKSIARLNGRTMMSLPYALSGRAKTVALIDLVAYQSFAEKHFFIQQLKEGWNAHLQNDDLYAWFSDESEGIARRRFAYDYLRKAKKNYQLGDILHFESMDDIHLFFDRNWISRDSTTLSIETIARAWRTHKTRIKNKENGKNQYNFVLSNQAIKRLDALAERYDLSRPEVLEVLVKMEAKNGTHLKEYMRLVESKKKVLEEEDYPSAPGLF